ncbi:MAG: DUF7501 family protein [Halobacteriota archaeon]
MSSEYAPIASESRWEDPMRCPFCDDDLVDGGAGFIAHISRIPSCRSAFDDWREQVANDVGGEWGG